MPDAPPAHAGSAFPLLSCFFEFWEEVEDLRRQVQADGEGDTFPAAAGGRERLAEALRSQRLSLAHPQATASQLQLEETQVYVMAATADELFIGMNWDGAAGWTMRPLEVELFGTRRAGDEVFARIDRLAGGFGPVDTKMAAVYLTALELGFTGKCADDRATLDAYEARLRKLVGRRPATMARSSRSATNTRRSPESGLRLPGSRMWWSAAVAIAAVSLLVLAVTFARFRGSTIEDARQRLETSFGERRYGNDQLALAHRSARRIRVLLIGPPGAERPRGTSRRGGAPTGTRQTHGMKDTPPGATSAARHHRRSRRGDVPGAGLGLTTWERLLRQLRQERSRRPFDAVVVALPAALLLAPGAEEERLHLAAAIRDRFALLQASSASRCRCTSSSRKPTRFPASSRSRPRSPKISCETCSAGPIRAASASPSRGVGGRRDRFAARCRRARPRRTVRRRHAPS